MSNLRTLLESGQQVFTAEFPSIDGANMEKVERDSIHRTCYELTREAIVNWMQSVVPPEVDSA